MILVLYIEHYLHCLKLREEIILVDFSHTKKMISKDLKSLLILTLKKSSLKIDNQRLGNMSFYILLASQLAHRSKLFKVSIVVTSVVVSRGEGPGIFVLKMQSRNCAQFVVQSQNRP